MRQIAECGSASGCIADERILLVSLEPFGSHNVEGFETIYVLFVILYV